MNTTIKVYQYWDKGEDSMPPIIKYIYDHNLSLSLKHNFELVLLTKNNIREYIDNIDDDFFNLQPNHQSDICRFNILHQYGGIWLDSDIIILKNIGKQYENFCKSNYEMILDIEFDNKIGCAAIYSKKNCDCTNYSMNYLSSKNNQIKNSARMYAKENFWKSIRLEKIYFRYLRLISKRSLRKLKNYFLTRNSNDEKLKWGTLGPELVKKLYEKYNNKILLNDAETVKKGCNFIIWSEKPGLNCSGWMLSDEKSAKEKAINIYKNSFYIITWSIYKENNYKSPEDSINSVFNNKKSVFHHLVKISQGCNY